MGDGARLLLLANLTPEPQAGLVIPDGRTL
jgi:hypothetical protein